MLLLVNDNVVVELFKLADRAKSANNYSLANLATTALLYLYEQDKIHGWSRLYCEERDHPILTLKINVSGQWYNTSIPVSFLSSNFVARLFMWCDVKTVNPIKHNSNRQQINNKNLESEFTDIIKSVAGTDFQMLFYEIKKRLSNEGFTG